DWLVSGAARGTYYIVVHVGGDRWTCTCEAGRRGWSCYHAAGAFLASLRDQSGRPLPATRPEGLRPETAAPATRTGTRGAILTEEEAAIVDSLYGPRKN